MRYEIATTDDERADFFVEDAPTDEKSAMQAALVPSNFLEQEWRADFHLLPTRSVGFS